MLLHFNPENHHSHFAFSFLTSVSHLWLFTGFQKLNIYNVSWLFKDYIHRTLLACWQSPKRSCYLSVSILASKNISGSLFVVCLSLNMFFLPFWAFLTWKWTNICYVAAFYTLNTHSTPCFLVHNHYDLPFMLFFTLRNINRTFLLTSKPLNILGSTMSVFCFLLSTLFLRLFAV